MTKKLFSMQKWYKKHDSFDIFWYSQRKEEETI